MMPTMPPSRRMSVPCLAAWPSRTWCGSHDAGARPLSHAPARRAAPHHGRDGAPARRAPAPRSSAVPPGARAAADRSRPCAGRPGIRGAGGAGGPRHCARGALGAVPRGLSPAGLCGRADAAAARSRGERPSRRGARYARGRPRGPRLEPVRRHSGDRGGGGGRFHRGSGICGMTHAYWLGGLKLASDFPLPALAPWDGLEVAADIAIRRGQVPPGLDQPDHVAPIFQTRGRNEYLLTLPGTGRILVRNGSEVTVDAEAGADASGISAILSGTIQAVLWHQRGVLPLHASVVAVGGRAVALCGPTASGKSALAAMLAARGCAVIADDL